jgi:hypothetical protein
MMCMNATTEILDAPVRGAVEDQIESLKERLLQPILQSLSADLVKEISWAANEAAALAWLTVCPILVLPILLEEKIQETLKKREKQQGLRQR